MFAVSVVVHLAIAVPTLNTKGIRIYFVVFRFEYIYLCCNFIIIEFILTRDPSNAKLVGNLSRIQTS